MKRLKLNLLDIIVAITGCCAVGVVIYLKKTQGRLYLAELLYMGLAIVGYSRYRTTKKKEPILESSAAP